MGEEDEVQIGDVWRDPSDGELQLVRELETESDDEGNAYEYVWAGWDEAACAKGKVGSGQSPYDRDDEAASRWDLGNFQENFKELVARPGMQFAWRPIINNARVFEVTEVRSDGKVLLRSRQDGQEVTVMLRTLLDKTARLSERLPAGFDSSPHKPAVGEVWLWADNTEGAKLGDLTVVVEVSGDDSPEAVRVRHLVTGEETNHGYALRRAAVRVKASDHEAALPEPARPAGAPRWVAYAAQGARRGGYPLPAPGDLWRLKDGGGELRVERYITNDDGLVEGVWARTASSQGPLGSNVAQIADLVRRGPSSDHPPTDSGGLMGAVMRMLTEGVGRKTPEKGDARVTKDPAPSDDTAEDEQEETNMATRKKDEFQDVQLVRQGEQVILPQGMSCDQGIKWLQRIKEEDERLVGFSHEIDAYPLEGAYALYRALREKFGFVSLQATPGFFGDRPPTMVGLNVSPTERVQVPWGQMAIPGIKGHLATGIKANNKGEVSFVLRGEACRKDEARINEVVALVREFVSGERSIYRNKAIHVTFPKAADGEGFDPSYTPRFMDLDGVKKDHLVFPKATQELIETALFTPIERSALCRRLGIPLKRGVLLEGPFGVGKTLTASVTAKLCTENGWTFVYLDRTEDLQKAVMFARNYQPAVIFAEDIDQQMKGDDRDAAMDGILNTIDGVDSKHQEVIVVLTTNHVDKISRAMLRPGRLDAVIPVREPDAEAAVRLVKLYASGLLREGEDLVGTAGRVMAGMIPSVIGEVVQRAKLAAVKHAGPDASRIELTAADLVEAAESIRGQLEHLNRPERRELGPFEQGCKVLADAIRVRPEHEKGNGLRGISAAIAAVAEGGDRVAND